VSLFTIDKEKCKRDGICVAVCPVRIIELKDDSRVPTPVESAEEICIKCGHCVSVCPHGAFMHSIINLNDCPPVRKDFAFSLDQAEYFLRFRRSIRTFTEKEVDNDTLTKLIDIARYAPTAGNSQQVGWIIFNSREKVKTLSGLVVDMVRDMIKKKHPLTEKYRLANIVKAWDSGKDGISRGAPALVIAHAPKDYPIGLVDSTIALTYIDLAAPCSGLGTCWGGFFMMALSQWQPLLQALELPEGHSCFGVMMIGHPKYNYHRLPSRKEARIIWKK
jgi:nitroreductase/NAD-dependent dihydropyrimidine dehydrogenase PreA subunit